MLKHVMLSLIAIGCSIFSFAQSATTTTYYPAVPTKGDVASSQHPPSQPFVAPIFIETPTTHSSLVLVNVAVADAGGSVTVRDSSGKPLASKHVVVKGNGQLTLPIGDLLPTGHFLGSISVEQDPDLLGMVILGQLIVTDNTAALPSYLDEELAMPMPDDSSLLRGVTAQADGPPLIGVTNLARRLQNISMICLAEDGSAQHVTLPIPALGTSLTRGCTDAAVPSIDEYIADAKTAHNQRESVTGIELRGDSGGGTLAAFAIAAHKLSDRIVLSAVNFQDPNHLHSRASIFAGVPLGSPEEMPNATYHPAISLVNFANRAATVTISIHSSIARDARATETERNNNEICVALL